MRKHLLFIIFLLVTHTGFTQINTIKGVIKDETSGPLIGAIVTVFKDGDSVNIKQAMTIDNGAYTISNLQQGNYILKANYLGYQDAFRIFSITPTSTSINIDFQLKLKADQIGEVTITEKAVTSVQKGDTSVFNSSAFKTNADANAEDLLTKMPGINTVNGKVQAQGEDVRQILVDGKPFFGDDPNAVLKNLPAEVIEKIEVFDRRSDQSQFTGFDDGNAAKTINIITKPSFRNGTFGRVFGGVNDNEQYKAGLVLNSFKENRRLTLLVQSNNVNEQNFSQEDLAGVMSSSGNQNRGGGMGRGMRGGGGMRGPGGGNDGSQFQVNQRGGINTTHAFGLNYSDKWGKKIDVSGSYFFNFTNNSSITTTNRTYTTTSDQLSNYFENNLSNSDNINQRLNFRFEYKIDTFNSILVQPRVSYQINKGDVSIASFNSRNDSISSQSSNFQNSKLSAGNFSLPILYRKGFEKRGRTISLNITPGYNYQDGYSMLDNRSRSLIDTTMNDTINQRSDLDKNVFTVNTNITYTEPLDSNSAIIISYGINRSQSESDKITNQLSLISNEYNDFDTTLSNAFKSIYTTQTAGLGYRYQKKAFTAGAGFNLQKATLDNDQQFPVNYNLKRSFNSILPNAMLMYRLSEKKNLRFFYRSSNNSPSVDQLQEVLNNTNPFQLSIGNANLDQDEQHFLVLRYSSVNTKKSTSFFSFIGATFTNNYIGNSSFVAQNDTVISGVAMLSGAQLNRPVNLNGYYNLRGLVSYGMPMEKFIKSNWNFNLSGSLVRSPSLINNLENFASTPSAGLGIVWSSNISTRWDFTLSTQNNYSKVTNSLQRQLNSGFISQQNRIKINILPLKRLVLNTELTQQIYESVQGTALSQNFVLWNAGIGYKFMKKDAAEIRVTVFDILNQNTSVSRNLTDTYVEDVYTNILNRYFMLNFQYKFSSF